MDNQELEFERFYQQYADMVYRLAFIYLKSTEEARDVTQDVFVKAYRYFESFDSEEHAKSWLLVTVKHQCLNYLSYWWYKKRNHDELLWLRASMPVKADYSDVLEAVISLPQKYKSIIYLYYYEGYSTKEISRMMKLNESTLRTRMTKARQLLKEKIGGMQEHED